MENIKITNEKITSTEYIDFLKRSDLGLQYPKERFLERINKLVNNVSISLTARNKDNILVGVLFGLTDFAYWLYITDLGVDRSYGGQGIGSSLVKEAHKIAGGEKDIAIYLVANDGAIPFYQKLGMKKSNEVMEYNHVDWTPFKVE
jgi:predicted N-acetyltransferase YhbS